MSLLGRLNPARNPNTPPDTIVTSVLSRDGTDMLLPHHSNSGVFIHEPPGPSCYALSFLPFQTPAVCVKSWTLVSKGDDRAG